MSAFALVMLAPLFGMIALAIRIKDPGPVFFAHRRIGQEGKWFGCLKFRSMVIDAEFRLADVLDNDPDAAAEWHDSQKLRKDPRVTALGRFLRRSSLDELPQLLNVLRGEMSIVGPRPIVADEIARYGENFAAYCSVRPGITGAAQISGRTDLAYKDRVRIDTDYIARKSLLVDLLIVMKTVPHVMTGKGAV